jgi:hypothetical protein
LRKYWEHNQDYFVFYLPCYVFVGLMDMRRLCKLVALKITSLMTKLANNSLLHIYYSWKNNKDLISYELSYQNMENFWLSCDQLILGAFSLTFSSGGNMLWGRRWIEPNGQMNQYIFNGAGTLISSCNNRIPIITANARPQKTTVYLAETDTLDLVSLTTWWSTILTIASEIFSHEFSLLPNMKSERTCNAYAYIGVNCSRRT